jgi:hypothetical protein
MSGAEQFTAAVPERSDPTDWRGALERSGAMRGGIGWGAGGGGPLRERSIPRPRYAREKSRAQCRRVPIERGTIGGKGRRGNRLRRRF